MHDDRPLTQRHPIYTAENRDFMAIMQNFILERLGIAASILGMTRCLFEETRTYVAERQAYGKALREHQVVRHKLVDMTTSIQAIQAMLDTAIWKVRNGDPAIADTSRMKALFATEHERCAADAVQLHSGAGIIRGIKVERIFRESKILSIGGGSTEVMKDLVARQEGI